MKIIKPSYVRRGEFSTPSSIRSRSEKAYVRSLESERWIRIGRISKVVSVGPDFTNLTMFVFFHVSRARMVRVYKRLVPVISESDSKRWINVSSRFLGRLDGDEYLRASYLHARSFLAIRSKIKQRYKSSRLFSKKRKLEDASSLAT